MSAITTLAVVVAVLYILAGIVGSVVEDRKLRDIPPAKLVVNLALELALIVLLLVIFL